jgi:hypothetical protein
LAPGIGFHVHPESGLLLDKLKGASQVLKVEAFWASYLFDDAAPRRGIFIARISLSPNAQNERFRVRLHTVFLGKVLRYGY